MKVYLDDDSASRLLSTLRRNAGHDVSIPADLGISGAPDPAHLIQAILCPDLELGPWARRS
jgi:hypothetical protein